MDLVLDPKAERDTATEALAEQRNRISESTSHPEAKARSSRVSDAIVSLMEANPEDQGWAFKSLSQEDKDLALQVMQFICNKMDASPTLK